MMINGRITLFYDIMAILSALTNPIFAIVNNYMHGIQIRYLGLIKIL